MARRGCESSHAHGRTHQEGSEIGPGGARFEHERRGHAEDVARPGHPVHHPECERGMLVPSMSTALGVVRGIDGPISDVDVRVSVVSAFVLMLVGVDDDPSGPVEGPRPERDEKHAHEPLRAPRPRLEIHDGSRRESRRPEGDDSDGMTEPPRQTHGRGAGSGSGGKGKDGSQMIRSGEHVDGAGRETSEDGERKGVRYLHRDVSGLSAGPEPSESRPDCSRL